MTDHVLPAAAHDAAASPHAPLTRLLHGGLAIAVTVQLLASTAMVAPEDGHPADALFEVHENAGLAALGLATAFWIAAMVRRRGTAPGALLPWFSASRRAALGADLRRHLAALRALRLPAHAEDGALASAIHGLGLLLMLGMAMSGTAWLLAGNDDAHAGGLAGLALDAHRLCGNLVWAYLIGHAAMGALHHLRGEASLARMWGRAG